MRVNRILKPIRVNDILLLLAKSSGETILTREIRKLVMSGSETGIGMPDTKSRRSVSEMAASLCGAQGAIREV